MVIVAYHDARIPRPPEDHQGHASQDGGHAPTAKGAFGPGSRAMTSTQTTRRTVLTSVAAAAAFGLATGTAEAQTSGRPPRGRQIGILLYDGFSLLDPTGPAELLSRLPDTTVTMIAEHRGPVRTDTQDVAVQADRSVAEVDRLDVLLVPGAGNRGTVGAMQNPVLLDWIRRIDRHT